MWNFLVPSTIESNSEIKWNHSINLNGIFYFQQFRKDSTILEEGGKSLNAITLFTLVLKYLKSHFVDSLEESALYTSHERGANAKYVITVPTKWDNASRECMKSAAKKVCINEHRAKPLLYMNLNDLNAVFSIFFNVFDFLSYWNFYHFFSRLRSCFIKRFKFQRHSIKESTNEESAPWLTCHGLGQVITSPSQP